MANPEPIINLAAEGVRPSKIASTLKLPIEEVTEALTLAIKKGLIKRSTVLETLEKHLQEEMSFWLPSLQHQDRAHRIALHGLMKEMVSNFDLTLEELNLYLLCYERAFKDGEIYEALCDVERTLHTKIKEVLISKYGKENAAWWKIGVPLGVRKECTERAEENEGFVEYPPYNCTTLGNLCAIVNSPSNAASFNAKLPLARDAKPPNLDQIKKDLSQLTKIRNKVMHPIGAVPPTEEEWFFVKAFRDRFEMRKWR